MKNASLAAVAVFCLAARGTARPQDPPLTASEMKAAVEADLRGRAAELYGPDDAARWMATNEGPANTRARATVEWLRLPSPPEPPETAGTVSINSLRHSLPKAARKTVERAQKLSKSGNYSEAARELEKALALDPDNAEILNNLGAQYFRLGRYAEAETQLQRAIELDPSSSAAHSNLAAAQLVQKNLTDAEKHARRALQLSGSNDRARYLLGLILASNPATWEEGLQNLEYASRSVPMAKAVLKSLRDK